ncbi:MAG TPA: PBP1A family penicillin-binding protein, partial [Candidatus Elarobacter sp.]|nr:PBP1A family penicillin-binding protein [Candidatus Elarobacter sp.]
FAVDGRFIAELGTERRTLVKLGEIPKMVQDAFVVTEDKRFYQHSGVDWIRVCGSALSNLRSGRYSQGFSTITMQLARNVFPERISREKNLVRKIKEAKVARDIEAKYSKDKILELYLNQINLGNGAYGVETASQRYFGKSVRDLNIAEAATLAALPKAPERYNPRRYPDRAIQRRNTIIELMRANGIITDADASLAKAYPLQLATKVESGETAPYFVEWVRQQLDHQFGKQLYEQGLNVYTTLDLDMQTAAERGLERQLRAIEGGRFGAFKHPTYEEYVARLSSGEPSNGNSPYLQGAFIALDPRTGGVRAMVGGRDFFDSKFNRATQALRQPGSTFKPIVYSTAIQNGKPASYVIDDSPVSVPQANGTNWEPQNYDLKFQGPMTMRRGLYQSRNIIAIKVGQELGEQAVINEARNFGITTPIPAYPSIFIGSADVIPLEMIGAYTTFATLGVRATPNAILRVENNKHQVIWQPTPVRTQVMTPEESWLMVSMMKDVIQRGTAYGSVWDAGFHVPAGGKTGTTNDGTNVWFIGYTADLVAGVWMGFDKPQTIKGNAQGGILAAPAWTSFMTEVYRRKPTPPDWPMPYDITTREIDARTGLLWSPTCAGDASVTEYYLPGTEPVNECGTYAAPPGAPGTPVPDTSHPPR